MFGLDYNNPENFYAFISEDFETLQDLAKRCKQLILEKGFTFDDLIVSKKGSNDLIDPTTFLGGQVFSASIIVGRDSEILLTTDKAKELLNSIDDTIKKNHPLASRYDYEGLIAAIDYTACDHTHKLTLAQLKNIANNTWQVKI